MSIELVSIRHINTILSYVSVNQKSVSASHYFGHNKHYYYGNDELTELGQQFVDMNHNAYIEANQYEFVKLEELPKPDFVLKHETVSGMNALQFVKLVDYLEKHCFSDTYTKSEMKRTLTRWRWCVIRNMAAYQQAESHIED